MRLPSLPNPIYDSFSHTRSLVHDLADTLISIVYIVVHLAQRIFSSHNDLVRLLPLTIREIGSPNDSRIVTIEGGFFPGINVRLPIFLPKKKYTKIYHKEIGKDTTLVISAIRIYSNRVKIIKEIYEKNILKKKEQYYNSSYLDKELTDEEYTQPLHIWREIEYEELGVEKWRKKNFLYYLYTLPTSKQIVVEEGKKATLTAKKISKGLVSLQKQYKNRPSLENKFFVCDFSLQENQWGQLETIAIFKELEEIVTPFWEEMVDIAPGR